MALTSSDVSLNFSGGGTNSNPDDSLGGDPSVQPIISTRLFDNVSDDQSKDGMTDYRCIYLNNNSTVDSLYNAQVLVSYTVPGDVSVALGFNFQNERQNLTVTNINSITGGSFTLRYTDSSGNHNFTVPWNATLSTWAMNLQTAIRDIEHLEDVTVTASLSGSSAVFEINFVEASGWRNHDVITLFSNSLTPSSVSSVSIVKSLSGGPINSIADEIDVDTTTPNNIVFSTDAVTIGDFRPLDSTPIWIKRIVPANTAAIEDDGFDLRIKGDGLPTE